MSREQEPAWLGLALMLCLALAGCFSTDEPWLPLDQASLPLLAGNYVATNARPGTAGQDVRVEGNHYVLDKPVSLRSAPVEPPMLAYLVKIDGTDHLYAVFVPDDAPAYGWSSFIASVHGNTICYNSDWEGEGAPPDVVATSPGKQPRIASAARLVAWLGAHAAEFEHWLGAKECMRLSGATGQVRPQGDNEFAELDQRRPTPTAEARPPPTASRTGGLCGSLSGVVKWYNSTKGYGFIQPDEPGKDVFVHVAELQRSGLGKLSEKQVVRFNVATVRGLPAASDICVVQ